ncbi:MAG: hypothetical protein KF829_03995 [Ferruginibacter sp.]|nr:hypothetical protein [Ferruginibacter sp.]
MEYIIEYLRKEIREHNLKSGEIIFEYDSYVNNKDLTTRLKSFFDKHNITTENTNPTISEITRQEAIESIKYGLSTKANYTVIDKEFNESDKNKFVHMFLDLFKQPKFYTLDCKLYQTLLDTNDFWEIGGAILLDYQSIGILWTNDLYEKFK